MEKVKTLIVKLGGRKVGTLAVTGERLTAFAYEDDWLDGGFSISPFSLPLENKVFIPKSFEPFEGLFGVFSDSLPDGWGRLLVDRLLAKKNRIPAETDSLTRLAIVADTGMGALTYEPEIRMESHMTELSLDQIAAECKKMFDTDQSKNLDTLYQMGGSSGGARPKIFYTIDDTPWIVKFPSAMDGKNIGKQEYDYSLCAKNCGILMPETRLLPSKRSGGYFAVKRFDRMEGRRLHMVSASGLLETSHCTPNLDYHILMQLTMQLTKSYAEVEKLYRLMCFNVFAHNRDDHSKNFSYLYDEDRWILSPAYDLTFSSSIGGEHATTVDGNGVDPGLPELLAVAAQIGFDKNRAKHIAEEIREIVYTDLRDYLKKARKR